MPPPTLTQVPAPPGHSGLMPFASLRVGLQAEVHEPPGYTVPPASVLTHVGVVPAQSKVALHGAPVFAPTTVRSFWGGVVMSAAGGDMVRSMPPPPPPPPGLPQADQTPTSASPRAIPFCRFISSRLRRSTATSHRPT